MHIRHKLRFEMGHLHKKKKTTHGEESRKNRNTSITRHAKQLTVPLLVNRLASDKDSVLMSASMVSSHCSGIGPDQLILKGFLRAAIHVLGLPLDCNLQHHFSVDTRLGP